MPTDAKTLAKLRADATEAAALDKMKPFNFEPPDGGGHYMVTAAEVEWINRARAGWPRDAKAVADLAAEVERLQKLVKELHRVGGMMSNLCWNLGRRDNNASAPAERESMLALAQQWDAIK